MDSARKYIELECEICSAKYLQQERVFNKAKWKYRCSEHRFTNHKCIDCGKIVCRGSLRCKKCYGKTMIIERKESNCIDCGIKIMHTSKRCLKCHNIKQNKGKTTERNKFNNSKKWASIRTKCFERDKYTCQACGDRNYKGRNKALILNAHHIKSWKSSPNLRLILDNLITYCEKCHFEWHNKNGRK